MANDLVLRPATPADSPFLAWGVDEAARGLFRQMFGSSSAAILTAVLTEQGHEYSYENAVIVQRDGSPLGMCIGFPYGTPSCDAALTKAAKTRASLRAAAVMFATAPIHRAMAQRTPGQWYMEAIAVKPEARGTGAGSALFADGFARARAAGCTTLGLDVDVRNPRAQALYERQGLVATSTSRRAMYLAGTRMRRMSAPVPPASEKSV